MTNEAQGQSQPGYLRLGVNIDHVATLRNARGGGHPDPLRAAFVAAEAGADGITAHLREDRRHIADADIVRLMERISLPLNFEMAVTPEMQEIALRHRPHACCLVPEKRREVTTEGGLDVAAGGNRLPDYIARLKDAGMRVSLFVDPTPRQVEAAARVGGDIVELHAGAYCEAHNAGDARQTEIELARIVAMAPLAAGLGLEVHVGHGLTFDTVAPVAELAEVVELNIGHYLIGEAIFSGLDSAIRRMRTGSPVSNCEANSSI
ncbi:MAG: pyridoxine 5'-phosphate synthase, partial [Hyphomicrobiales bacterium]